MKAVTKKQLKEAGSEDVGRQLKKANALMREAISDKMFLPHFANQEMYLAFNKDLLLPGIVAKLFRDGHIDYFHHDISYPMVAIVDTEEGKVLTVPVHFQMSELMELLNEVYAKPEKKVKES